MSMKLETSIPIDSQKYQRLFFAMHLFVLLGPAYAIIAATFSVRQVKKV